jgi:hypothetical protein
MGTRRGKIYEDSNLEQARSGVESEYLISQKTSAILPGTGQTRGCIRVLDLAENLSYFTWNRPDQGLNPS